LDPYHPDSLNLIGTQPLPVKTGFETIGIVRSAKFPDNSILLALSNRGQNRVCFLRGISLTDFNVLYSYDWDKLGSSKFDLVGRRDDKETTYVCNYDYLYNSVYQIYEIIRYDTAHPWGSAAYITLDKIDTRIVDLWDLARKRFHIKGKFNRYK
jgi:hypothetical protein